MREFQIFAETLKTIGGEGDGKRRLHGVASSTVKDRHGDVITLEALQKMERQATGMTIFANHDYTVPESVMGTVEKAQLRQHPSDIDIYDLVYDIVINEANPRAIQSWESQSQGTQLGLSIGARIPKDGATKSADGAYIINDIELLETSIVGVPASPRSWVDYAVKALRREEIIKSTSPSAIGVDVEEADEADDDVEKATAMELATADEPAVEVVTETPSPEGQDEPPVDEEAEPEREPAYSDTEVDVLDSDEPDTPQDAPEPESQPESGDELLQNDEETEITLAALVASADTLAGAHAIIENLNRELGSAKKEARTAAEERDQVVEKTVETMDTATSLLERLEKTSMGRKTHPVVAETAKSLQALGEVYTKDVMALLTKER